MLPTGLIIFLICVASCSAESEKLNAHGQTKIRDPCERDVECIQNAFCKVQQFCLCDTNYAPNLERTRCHITLGAACDSTDPHSCDTMSNAVCRQNVCACRDDFMIDFYNSSNCIMSPKAPGDICHSTEQCRDAMEMAHCINNKCDCFTGHGFVNETRSCIKKRGLYEPCKKDYECFFERKYPNEMECKDGTCSCRPNQPHCNKGSSLSQSIFSVLSVLYFLCICKF